MDMEVEVGRMRRWTWGGHGEDLEMGKDMEMEIKKDAEMGRDMEVNMRRTWEDTEMGRKRRWTWR